MGFWSMALEQFHTESEAGRLPVSFLVQTELLKGPLGLNYFCFRSPVLCPGDKDRNPLWSLPMLVWEQYLLLLGGLFSTQLYPGLCCSRRKPGPGRRWPGL